MRSIRLLLTVVFNLLFTTIFAQSIIVDSQKNVIDVSGDFNNADIQLSRVSKPAEYPGGKLLWFQYLRNCVSVANIFSKRPPQGLYSVIIYFTISTDGSIKFINPETNNGFDMEKEIIKCIQNSIKWSPAETGSGRKVIFGIRNLVHITVKANDIFIGP